MIRYLAFTFLVLFIFKQISAQDAGDSVFDDDILHEVRIEFSDTDYWSLLEENYQGVPPGQPVPYIMAAVSIDGITTDSIGIRFKGFTSFAGAGDKKPFKLDFNEFVPGQRVDGLRKLNLNNGTADPALLRDFISYDLLRSMGVAAPRTSFANVYLNDEYWGVYQLIEQVDKEFLDRNFANPDGNLFKNLGWSKFEWLGPNEQQYKQIFSLKTNEEADDWTGFVNFVDFLNNATDQEFEDGIADIFDVDLFLKTLCVDVALNNWDSYLDHGRNWYMYEDTSTDIFHWIPWDYNLALGGTLSFGGGDTTDCLIFPEFAVLSLGTTTVEFIDNSFYFGGATFDWDFGDGNTSTVQSPTHTYTTQGTYTVCLEITTHTNCTERVCTVISTEDDLNLCPSMLENPLFPEGATANFAILLQFIPTCCDIWGEECSEFYDILSGGTDGFGNFAIDQSENEGVLIRRVLAVDQYRDRYYDYFCDLLANHYTHEHYSEYIDFHRTVIEDAVAEDPFYPFSEEEFLADIGPEGLKALILSRIEDLTEELATSGHDCPDFAAFEAGTITINELVASSDSTSGTPDNAGEYDDWIELYNTTDEEVDLAGAYLSDSKTDFKKWQFPIGTSIPANGYLIVWADGDEEQSGIHTSFKLNKGGDELRLSNADGSVVDSVSFESLETNVALARVPNGTGPFVEQAPTHGFSNEVVSTKDEGDISVEFALYPVPAQDRLTVHMSTFEANLQLHIMDVMGRFVYTTSIGSGTETIDISSLTAGMYIARIQQEKGLSHALTFMKL